MIVQKISEVPNHRILLEMADTCLGIYFAPLEQIQYALLLIVKLIIQVEELYGMQTIMFADSQNPGSNRIVINLGDKESNWIKRLARYIVKRKLVYGEILLKEGKTKFPIWVEIQIPVSHAVLYLKHTDKEYWWGVVDDIVSDFRRRYFLNISC